MRRLLLIILAATGTLATLYFTWALYRVDVDVIVHDPAWPRPFPYPDPWLMHLNNIYDAMYPAPGAIKLRGELHRVTRTVQAAAMASALIASAGILPLAWPLIRRYGTGKRSGLDVLPRTDAD